MKVINNEESFESFRILVQFLKHSLIYNAWRYRMWLGQKYNFNSTFCVVTWAWTDLRTQHKLNLGYLVGFYG